MRKVNIWLLTCKLNDYESDYEQGSDGDVDVVKSLI